MIQSRLNIFIILLIILLLPIRLAASEFHSSASSKKNHIEQQFALFSHEWINKLDRNYSARLEKKEFETHESGYTGRYMQVDRESVSWTVKETSNSPLTYIGLLEYLEWTYECVAPTRLAAELGPFVQVHGRKVTEIFQYKANRWAE